MKNSTASRLELIVLTVTLTLYTLIIVSCFFVTENYEVDYTTKATVKAIGSKGITVSYTVTDDYGSGIEIAKIDADPSKYNIGDIVTIDIYNIHDRHMNMYGTHAEIRQ